MSYTITRWSVPGYTEIRELGRGGQGIVFLARDEDDELAAIKYIEPRLLETQFADLFRAEAEILSRLDDPNIARIKAYVEDDHGAAIVMEYVQGATLRHILDHGHPKGLTPQAALTILKGSLKGLSAAHKAGLVHRDYKPKNIVVKDTGASKLIDFGIAALSGEAGYLGTPEYMAPEQWKGGPASPATDVYAATCVFYECVTGHRPYESRTTRSGTRTLEAQHTRARIPTRRIPRKLRSLVMAGMAKSPASRPTNADAFIDHLEMVAVAAYGPDWEKAGRIALRTAATVALMTLPVLAPHVIASITAQGTRVGARAKAAGASVAGIGIAAAAILVFRDPAPAITHAEARQALAHYIATANAAAKSLDTEKLKSVQSGPEMDIAATYYKYAREHRHRPAGTIDIREPTFWIPREFTNGHKWFVVEAGEGSAIPWMFANGTSLSDPNLSAIFSHGTMVFSMEGGSWKVVMTINGPVDGKYPAPVLDEDGYATELADAATGYTVPPQGIPDLILKSEDDEDTLGETRCTIRTQTPKDATAGASLSVTGWKFDSKARPTGEPVYALKTRDSALVWASTSLLQTGRKIRKTGWTYGPPFTANKHKHFIFYPNTLTTDRMKTWAVVSPASSPAKARPYTIGCRVGLTSYSGT
ncbi:serine/threonine protein kinase [Actinocorallia herbida]|uniref:Serine/threonine protein kinase n=1 Tax=Actinocorallia herbida TaxID=58109 RepID=A0A3N1D5C0_9ACTN|nr:serine/threonine-protein kinase [Actinocorallia herbida]ROO88743.1 serine/threonine protein kinase [Actinocorallia herbida]